MPHPSHDVTPATPAGSRSAADRAKPAAVAQRKPNGTGLPGRLKAGVERLSGRSLDHVRVHRNSSQPAQLNAHAFAQGSDIHVAPGQEKHLPHEAWHVVQQMQGRVKPTQQLKSVAINDDSSLEREADTMGRKAAQLSASDPVPALAAPAATPGAPVLQPFWVRDGGEPVWKSEYLFNPNWYVQAEVATKRRINDPKKKKGYRNITEQVPETKFTLTGGGWLAVYRPRAAMAARLPQIDTWLGAWPTAKTTAILAHYNMVNGGDFALVAKHAADFTAMTTAQVTTLMAYPKATVDIFLHQLAGGALAPRIREMDAWRARWGAPKAAAIFATFNMGNAADYALVHKHAAEFSTLNVAIVTGMMARTKAHVATFLTTLNAGELSGFFRGTLPRSQALVATNAEFGSLATLARTERRFDQAAVLPLNPTASQGAHFLREHGAHNSPHQTIRMAVEYALRGGGAATKGNWISNEAEQVALDWAKARTDLEVQAAAAINTAAASLVHLPTTHAVGHAPIFGVPASPTAHIYNHVAQVLGGAADYEHGNVSGVGGAAQVTITGDYQTEAGVAIANTYAGAFNGNLTGAALANNATAANQALSIVKVAGNGNAAVAVAGQTQAGGQLAGSIRAPVTIPNAQVSLKTGAGPTTRYFNGHGNYTGMMSAAIVGADSAWVRHWSTVTGDVHDQVLDDGCGNQVQVRKVEVQGPNTGNRGVGMNVTGNGSAYTPGSRDPIDLLGGSKARNLQADVTNHTAGPTFTPNSLQQIVTHAVLAGKYTSYKRAAAANNFTDQLLAPNIQIQGTLAGLQALGHLGGVADLSSLNLRVTNVTPAWSLTARNIDSIATPVANTVYSINLHNRWYTFTLAHFNPAPAQTNFRALLYLKNQNAAEYEAFTAYPT